MKNVEDIYPLSPMQELMLLHAVTTGKSDVLFNQFCYEIRGDLDVPAFRRAWQQLADRHPILRTAFLWEDLPQPLQVVREQVDLPFEVLDWSDVPPGEQQARLAALRASDRSRRFTTSRAPLTRFILVRLTDASSFFIWSSHHLLFDRWCLSTVLDELARCYDANRRGQPTQLGRARPFRDYINWIQQQDRSQAHEFWRRTLDGFVTPTLLAADEDPSTAAETGAAESTDAFELVGHELDALRAFVRQHGLTVGTIFHAAWALLLNHHAERQDVLFGTAAAGRPPDLAGIESIVGSFINNLPIRVHLPGDCSVFEWLQHIQGHQQERIPFEYVSLADIQRFGGLSPHEMRFDSIIVWLAAVGVRSPGGLEMREVSGGTRTVYPVTVTVEDTEARIAVRAYYSAARRLRRDSTEILPRLRRIVTALIGPPGRRLSELPGFAKDARGEPEPISQGAGARITPLDGDGHSPPLQQAGPALGRDGEEIEMLRSLVRNEWRTMLGRTTIGVGDNFFDLGGNSLLAVQLHARLEIVMGRSVPLLALFRAATVEHMARTLHDRKWPLQPSFVRPLRSVGSKPPLFCIASPEVNTLGYVQLARHLDSDQPVYVLQSQPDTDEVLRLAPADMPEVAVRYIAAMETVQSAGPFRLLGMCDGAHLALEMGNQLEAAGKPVAFIGLINTWALHTLTWLFHLELARSHVENYAKRVWSLVRLPPGKQVSEIRRVLRRKWHGLAGRLHARSRGDGASADAEPAAVTRPKDPWHDLGPHRGPPPPKYPGTVTVFRIKRQQFFRVRDATLGWSTFAETVRICHLPGTDHLSILREPRVGDLATQLSACLESHASSDGARP